MKDLVDLNVFCKLLKSYHWDTAQIQTVAYALLHVLNRRVIAEKNVRSQLFNWRTVIYL